MTPSLSPAAPLDLTEADKLALSQRLDHLRKLHATRPQHFTPPPGMTNEIELSAARLAWDEETMSLIREQISILSKLRRTSAGPSKKGGPRAKKAPLDLGALLAGLAKA